MIFRLVMVIVVRILLWMNNEIIWESNKP